MTPSIGTKRRDLWIPGDFGRRRWHFFRAHFQFLLANERVAYVPRPR